MLKRELTGKCYVAIQGPYTGQVIQVLGQDGLFPDPIDDRWLVRSEDGHKWSVRGDLLRPAVQATKQERR
ncbi:MAG: hypothetical protein Q8R28_11365 [Dehalococcoidia bacterium]|nr:hypothetical protein [Dehalococcoidia bacterium]